MYCRYQYVMQNAKEMQTWQKVNKSLLLLVLIISIMAVFFELSVMSATVHRNGKNYWNQFFRGDFDIDPFFRSCHLEPHFLHVAPHPHLPHVSLKCIPTALHYTGNAQNGMYVCIYSIPLTLSFTCVPIHIHAHAYSTG